MKLIHCPNCKDIVLLTRSIRYCECQQSAGLYLPDGYHAITFGAAISLGFSNPSFVAALHHQPTHGLGEEFTAFVIPVLLLLCTIAGTYLSR